MPESRSLPVISCIINIKLIFFHTIPRIKYTFVEMRSGFWPNILVSFSRKVCCRCGVLNTFNFILNTSSDVCTVVEQFVTDSLGLCHHATNYAESPKVSRKTSVIAQVCCIPKNRRNQTMSITTASLNWFPKFLLIDSLVNL